MSVGIENVEVMNGGLGTWTLKGAKGGEKVLEGMTVNKRAEKCL